MTKHEREVRKLAGKYGFKVIDSNSKHLKICRPNGSLVIATARTPSDHRGIRNLEQMLRREARAAA